MGSFISLFSDSNKEWSRVILRLYSFKIRKILLQGPEELLQSISRITKTLEYLEEYSKNPSNLPLNNLQTNLELPKALFALRDCPLPSTSSEMCTLS